MAGVKVASAIPIYIKLEVVAAVVFLALEAGVEMGFKIGMTKVMVGTAERVIPKPWFGGSL